MLKAAVSCIACQTTTTKNITSQLHYDANNNNVKLLKVKVVTVVAALKYKT